MDEQPIRRVVGVVVDPDEMALEPVQPPMTGQTAAAMVLAQMLARARQLSEEELVDRWEETIDTWLASKGAKSNSANTLEAYQDVVDAWMMFIGARPRFVSTRRRDSYRQRLQQQTNAGGCEPWQVTVGHVQRWMASLREEGKRSSTINQRLAVMSSLYKFVCRYRWIDEIGAERSIFVDSLGTPRENPFTSAMIERPKNEEDAEPPQPLSEGAVQAMLASCNQKSRTGARDFALLRTFLLTGWRCNEVLAMTWGRIRENPKFPGEYLYLWRGKGGKAQLEPLPATCYHAIVAYLKLDGRWPVQNEDEFIWQAISRHGVKNFGHEPAPMAEQPISSSTANNILRRHLQGVVDDPMRFHVHSLRHTHADQHYEAFKDLKATQQRLHHASPTTTMRYLQRMQTPRDNFSQQLELRLGI